jgi:acetyl-CoA carboxylase biotin carboxyl carrier protein
MKLHDADVQEIIRLLADSDYDELQLETEQFRLILRRGRAEQGGWSQERQTIAAPNILKPVGVLKPVGLALAQGMAGNPGAGSGERGEQRVPQDGLVEIPAPFMGTFYRAPQPATPAFVDVGSMVERDTVVAIIEVMKLMNSVAAGVAGEVVEICGTDATFVEQGQCLMRVRPHTATVRPAQG